MLLRSGVQSESEYATVLLAILKHRSTRQVSPLAEPFLTPLHTTIGIFTHAAILEARTKRGTMTTNQSYNQPWDLYGAPSIPRLHSILCYKIQKGDFFLKILRIMVIIFLKIWRNSVGEMMTMMRKAYSDDFGDEEATAEGGNRKRVVG